MRCLILIGAVIVPVLGAQAQSFDESKRATGDVAAKPVQAKRALYTGDAAEVSEALQRLARRGGPAAAVAVVKRLQKGLPPRLTEQAIETLAKIGHRRVVRVLGELTRHRRPSIRAKALRALGALRGKRVLPTLIEGLDDPHPAVRRVAARALGESGSRKALEPLVRAMERGMSGAAPAIAQLMRVKDVPRLVLRAGDKRFEAMAPALDAWLQRDDLPDAAKRRVVGQLGHSDLAAARDFLQGLARSDSALRVPAAEALENKETEPARGG